MEVIIGAEVEYQNYWDRESTIEMQVAALEILV
jgi:hypothetical protein